MARGAYRHVAVFQSPGAMVPDGEGGWVEGWADLDPASWPVSIEPATVRDMERVASGTVITTASHIITGDWRADVTTKTRMQFDGRTFHITGVQNIDERKITMRLLAEEQTP